MQNNFCKYGLGFFVVTTDVRSTGWDFLHQDLSHIHLVKMCGCWGTNIEIWCYFGKLLFFSPSYPPFS